MTPIQRVRAVLAHRRPDRPPVSFWYHFPADQVCGPAAVKAHVDHLQTYDLDWLKVMNDNGYPHDHPIQSIDDLGSIRRLRGDEPAFARQLELLADLRREVRGRVWMITTVFNAWAVLRQLIRPPREHRPPNLDAAADQPSQWIRDAVKQDAQAVTTALETIGRNLARFAARCVQAGGDGVFLSVRDDWVDSPQQSEGLYDRLVRPTDLAILAAVRGAPFNLLHVCGRPTDLRAFGQYPVRAVNWADRAAGPSIGSVKDWLKPAICGGVDNLKTLPDGTPDDVRKEVAEAISQAGDWPIMISPGCTYDPARVPMVNLRAVVDAARSVGQ